MSSVESSQLSSMLTETIRMLCQNGVDYNENLRIQGLLVVTADSNRVQVIEISDTFPSQQATGVGSSGLGDAEAAADYKPSFLPPAQDYPVQPAIPQQKPRPSFRTKASARRGFPAKRRGGFSAGFSVPRMAEKMPRMKMEDPVILLDSPDDTAGDMIEPKAENEWADAGDSYQNMPVFPEADDMPDYYGTGMDLYGGTPSSQPARGRGRGRRRHTDTVSHTITSSDDQFAQDMKPFQMNYDIEQDDGEIEDNVTDPSYYPTNSDNISGYSFELAPEGTANEEGATHFCQYRGCGFGFLHKRSLDRHQRQKHGALFGVAKQMAFFCAVEDCQRTFYAKSTFVNHQKNVHGIVSVTDEMQ